MSWKGTLLLLILAVVAAALLLGRAGHHRPPGAPLLGLDPEKVERIVIRDAGGEIVLAKLDGTWFVRSGTPDRADASLIRSILSATEETVPLDTLRPSELKGPVSLEALDLKIPRRSLTLTAGNRSETLSFGIEGAGKGRVYARLEGEAPVHLIATTLSDQIFRPAATFRDLRLTALRPDAPEKIEFTTPGTGGKTMLLQRKGNDGNDWRVGDPAAMTRADRAAVGRFTESLLGARIVRWMSPETSAASCGLETPSALFRIGDGGDGSPVTITLGKETGTAPGERYTACSDRKGICVVKEGLFTTLSPDGLRDRHPTPVQADAVDRIEIVTGGTNAPLLLQRRKGTEDWETPGGGARVPGNDVAAWISRLSGVEAVRFPSTGEAAPLPTEKPMVVRLVARLSENTAEEGAGEIILSEMSLFRLEGTEAVLVERGNPVAMMVPSTVLRPLVTEAAAWTGSPDPVAALLPTATPSPSPKAKKSR